MIPTYRNLKEAVKHFVELKLAVSRGKEAEAVLPELEALIVNAIRRQGIDAAYDYGDQEWAKVLVVVADGKLVFRDGIENASEIELTEADAPAPKKPLFDPDMVKVFEMGRLVSNRGTITRT